jgi:hypothetical protein
MTTIKEYTLTIYKQYIDLAKTDGRLFRKTVIDEIVNKTGCSLATASTNYNIIKKVNPVIGLGRDLSEKSKINLDISENDCYTVIELIPSNEAQYVGRCYSFMMQGDASECFDMKTYNSKSSWTLIKGLGPNSTEIYRLESDEEEIKKYEFKS